MKNFISELSNEMFSWTLSLDYQIQLRISKRLIYLLFLLVTKTCHLALKELNWTEVSECKISPIIS